MKRFWYRRKVKIVCFAIQGLLAGLLVFLLLSLVNWTEGQMSLSEMGRSFENTKTFLRMVQSIVEEKVSSDQDKELFETGGTYAPDKWIDIRQYMSGTLDESGRNPGTSYTIADLLAFAETDAETMRSRVDTLLGSSSEEEAGAQLLTEAAVLETILPETGTLLADYAKVSSGSSMMVVEYYRSLCDCALSVAARYEAYTADASEESGTAPSNILYYVENTSTRQRCSNFGAWTMSEAIAQLESMQEMTFLFEGERKSSIMVVDTERVLNEQTSQWFSQNPLVGSNEKIVIAVDLSFPIGDSLQTAYLQHQHRVPLIRTFIILAVVLAAVLLVLSGISLATAGKNGQDDEIQTLGIDHIPTEIETGLYLIVLVIGLLVIRRRVRMSGAMLTGRIWPAAVLCGSYYALMMGALLSLIRRLRAHTLWRDSVAYYVVLGSRQVLSARKSTQRLLLTYVTFIVLNLIFLMIGGAAGAVMMLAINMAALLSLMRESVGTENIREGLQQIQAGRLDYRVNVDVLYGESRQLGRAVNEMGEGLSKAVESMLQGERLKAELITNVSHDLKTPLTSIINYVDLLKREPAGSERSAQYLQILDQKTQRLKVLVTDLIEISKISSGNVELHLMPLDVREFVLQAAGEFEDRFADRGLVLNMQFPEKAVSVEADGEQLWRVFENLLGNIAKYAAEGSAVTIAVQTDESVVHVAFANQSAVKITANAQQLLERFTRGDDSRTTEGSGLGLSIAKSLTEYMGGTFSLNVEENLFEAVVNLKIL